MYNSSDNFVKRSFFDEYEETIAPQLKKIDILLKTTKFPISVSETSKTLNISNDEVFTILGKINTSQIDKNCFFNIMRNGSSQVCQLLRRELDCGSPHIYTPKDIAYIYDLDRNLVEKACAELYVTELTAICFPALFAMIPAN